MSAHPSHLSPAPTATAGETRRAASVLPCPRRARGPRGQPQSLAQVAGSWWLLGSGLRPRGLCTRVRVAFESGEAAWDLGSEGRCLDLPPHGQGPASPRAGTCIPTGRDLHPHGQAPAAAGRGVGVLGGDSHSGRSQLSGGLDAGCSPHLAHVRLPGCCGRWARCSDAGFPPRSQAKG